MNLYYIVHTSYYVNYCFMLFLSRPVFGRFVKPTCVCWNCMKPRRCGEHRSCWVCSFSSGRFFHRLAETVLFGAWETWLLLFSARTPVCIKYRGGFTVCCFFSHLLSSASLWSPVSFTCRGWLGRVMFPGCFVPAHRRYGSCFIGELFRFFCFQRYCLLPAVPLTDHDRSWNCRWRTMRIGIHFLLTDCL